MFNNLPKSWGDIKVSQYQDMLIELKKEQLDFSKQIQILSIISDIDMDNEVWDNMDVNEVKSILTKVNWLFKTLPSKTIDYNNKQPLILNKITLGEFIDLEYYFVNDFESNLHLIISILLRNEKEDEWGYIIQQPYTNLDVEKESKLLLNESINSVYGVIEPYINFRNNFLISYRDLFNPTIELSEEEEELQTEEDKLDIEKQDKLDQFSWEFFINKLVDGDITKYEEILNLPLIFIFNQVMFKKLFKID